MRETWESGDEAQRQNIVHYLMLAVPEEGLTLCWEAARSEDASLRTVALFAAGRYITRGYTPGPPEMETLLWVLRGDSDWPAKATCMGILERVDYPAYEEVLENLTSDGRPDVRFEANLRLCRRGRDTKKALFADLNTGRNQDRNVERMWGEKDRLNLTAKETEFLRSRIQDQMARRRQSALKPIPRNNSALFLFMWLKIGFPPEPDDVDLMGDAVSLVISTRERIEAVRAVAWFNNDRARDWLRRLSEEPYQPSVRKEAQRQLRKLTAH
jgi:hypothetical protein